MDWKTTITLLVTVVLAFIGYAAKYLNDLRLAQRNDRLDRVNTQLRELYGPLLSLVKASESAWEAFRSEYRSGSSYWHDKIKPSEAEAEAWRLWMREVFMPLNLEMTQKVINHSDLLCEDNVPQCLLDLNAHVQTYKAVIEAWNSGNYSHNTAFIDFPRRELTKYVVSSYAILKSEQRQLMESLFPYRANTADADKQRR